MQAKKCTIVNFSSRFKSLCEGSGRTQKELAKLIDGSESALVNYKKDRVPRADELLRISAFFDVSIEWLLTGNDEKSRGAPALSATVWKTKAEDAEKKIQAMKAGLQAFLKKF